VLQRRVQWSGGYHTHCGRGAFIHPHFPAVNHIMSRRVPRLTTISYFYVWGKISFYVWNFQIFFLEFSGFHSFIHTFRRAACKDHVPKSTSLCCFSRDIAFMQSGKALCAPSCCTHGGIRSIAHFLNICSMVLTSIILGEK